MNDSVKERHQAIKELIKEQMIEDQESLVEHLLQKKGIFTNQVQISRDLKHLGIGKKKIEDKMVYELPEENQIRDMLRLAKLEVVHNESLIVVKTLPGLAPFVGDYLDDQKDIGLLATLAGENTVFATPKTTKNIKDAYKRVCRALFYKIKDELK